MDWRNKLLLDLGMGGPNINKSFEKKLNKNFQENNVEFLSIGSCSVQNVHNIFLKGLPCLSKLSKRHIEDYTSLEEVTKVASACNQTFTTKVAFT